MDRNDERRTRFMLAHFDRAVPHVLAAHVNDVAPPLAREKHKAHREPCLCSNGMFHLERRNIFLRSMSANQPS